MAKPTLEEKRLLNLKKQLYGGKKDEPNLPQLAQTTHPTSDISYLKADLLKIYIFASAALGIEALIYFGQQMKLIHLGF